VDFWHVLFSNCQLGQDDCYQCVFHTSGLSRTHLDIRSLLYKNRNNTRHWHFSYDFVLYMVVPFSQDAVEVWSPVHYSVSLFLGNGVVGIGFFSDCCEIFCRQSWMTYFVPWIFVFNPVCVSQIMYYIIKMWWTCLAICRFLCNRCLFFGDVSSKRDPSTYLSYVFAIYDYYRKEYCISETGENRCNVKLPLIVNTPGWVKGKLAFFSCYSDSF